MGLNVKINILINKDDSIKMVSWWVVFFYKYIFNIVILYFRERKRNWWNKILEEKFNLYFFLKGII